MGGTASIDHYARLIDRSGFALPDIHAIDPALDGSDAVSIRIGHISGSVVLGCSEELII